MGCPAMNGISTNHRQSCHRTWWPFWSPSTVPPMPTHLSVTSDSASWPVRESLTKHSTQIIEFICLRILSHSRAQKKVRRKYRTESAGVLRELFRRRLSIGKDGLGYGSGFLAGSNGKLGSRYLPVSFGFLIIFLSIVKLFH